MYWAHVFLVVLLLTRPKKKSSPRGSVAQTADENIQSGESPYHSNHLVGLNTIEAKIFVHKLLLFRQCS